MSRRWRPGACARGRRRGRVPAGRESSCRPPGEALGTIGVAGRPRHEDDAERRSCGECHAREKHRSSLADRQGAEKDPAREHDAVEQPLCEERPGAHEHRNAALPHRLDAEEVAATGGEDVVRAAADRDGGEQLPEPDLVAGAPEEVAPPDRHDQHVGDHERQGYNHRPPRERGDLAPRHAQVDLSQEEPQERGGRRSAYADTDDVPAPAAHSVPLQVIRATFLAAANTRHPASSFAQVSAGTGAPCALACRGLRAPKARLHHLNGHDT